MRRAVAEGVDVRPATGTPRRCTSGAYPAGLTPGGAPAGLSGTQNVSTAGVISAFEPSGMVPGRTPTYSPEIRPPVIVNLRKP